MRIIALFALLVLTWAGTTAPLGAQTFGGVGARAEGMGGAFVAVADDASAVYWNPAGIATGATFDFQLFRGDGAHGSSWFAGASLPVLGFGVYRTHTVQGLADRQDEGPGVVEVRTLSTKNVGVTVVQSIVSNVVIGTTVRLVTGGSEPLDTRTTVDLDAGAMVLAGKFRLGLTGRNLRAPAFQGPSGPVPVTRQVRAGVALAPRALPSGVHGPYSVAFDADLTETRDQSGAYRMMAVGGEYWVADGVIGARAGVRWNTLDAEFRAVSGGVTVRLPRSVHLEGHLTKPRHVKDEEWSIGARVTF